MAYLFHQDQEAPYIVINWYGETVSLGIFYQYAI